MRKTERVGRLSLRRQKLTKYSDPVLACDLLEQLVAGGELPVRRVLQILLLDVLGNLRGRTAERTAEPSGRFWRAVPFDWLVAKLSARCGHGCQGLGQHLLSDVTSPGSLGAHKLGEERRHLRRRTQR